MTKKVEQYDVIIIGGGSAGLTAGIYCGRAKLKTLILEKTLIGGLATYTNEIENYPGFPDGTTGSELMNLFYKQAKNFGVQFKFIDVQQVDFSGDIKIVETFRTRYETDVVIVAGGGKPRLTGAKNEELYLYDKGISFCATCDAAANTDKTVMVIGSGDAAIEEGIFLTKFAKRVIVSVIHEEGKMDCNEIAKTQALANPKIQFIWNSYVDSFAGNDRLEQVILRNTKTEALIPVKVDSCFLFIGYLPNTDIFKDILNMDEHGYLLTNEKMETNLPGIFAAGDIRYKFLKQVATAVGDGAIAGYSAEKYIAEKHIYEQHILNEGKPSLVFFFNSVNHDCHELFPLIEKIEQQYHHNIKITKVDVYKSDGLAKLVGITQYPSVAYFYENKNQKIVAGDLTQQAIETLFSLSSE